MRRAFWGLVRRGSGLMRGDDRAKGLRPLKKRGRWWGRWRWRGHRR